MTNLSVLKKTRIIGTSGDTVPKNDTQNVFGLRQRVQGADPAWELRDTDEALPNGLWRWRLVGNTVNLERNTHASGDFSTVATPFAVGFGSGSQGYFSNAPVVGSSTMWHAGNDGPGSGLDADTVDGVQLSGLVQTSRTVSGGGLATGGGDLSANRTLTVTAASQAEAEAGAIDTVAMTPLRAAQALAANRVNSLAVEASVDPWGDYGVIHDTSEGVDNKALIGHMNDHGWDIIFECRETAGTEGGTYTAGSSVRRKITTEVYDRRAVFSVDTGTYIMTIAEAGTYECDIEVCCYGTGDSLAWLNNLTSAAVAAYSLSMFASNASNGYAVLRIAGRFTVAANDTFEVRFQGNTSQASFGLGTANNFGDFERYMRGRMKRVG